MYLRSSIVLLSFVLVCQGQYMRKGGVCPPPPNIDVCFMSCYDDSQCEGMQRCCRTACGGTFCVEPVTVGNVKIGDKPGVCPQPSGPWICSSRCSGDSDCRGSKKCCKNRCGAMACMKPAVLDEPYYA